jgi:hypothetical protein
MNMREKLKELSESGIQKVQIPNNGIEEPGMIDVANALVVWMNEKGIYKPWSNNLMYDLVGPQWLIIGKGHPTTGTFPKRLAKAITNTMHIDLDTKIMGQIGDIARKYCPKHADYLIDFTRKFNWRAGDFGDEGSCFWGERSAARIAMEKEDFYAMRFWDELDGRKVGVARCWLFPESSDGAVIFNAYPTSWSLQVMARVLAFMTGNSYRKIVKLTNKGSASDILYINGNRGQYVGPHENLDKFESYDFQLSIKEYENTGSCDVCGNCIDLDNDIYFDINDTEYVCNNCYADHYFSCNGCGKVRNISEINSIFGESYCDSCVRNLFMTCSHCGAYVNKEDIICVGEENLCSYCSERNTVECYFCGKIIHNDNAEKIADDSNRYYCYGCGKHNICDGCGDVFKNLISQNAKPDSEKLCEDCDYKKHPENRANVSKLAPTELNSEVFQSLTACPLTEDGRCSCQHAIEELNPFMNRDPKPTTTVVI